MSAELAPCPFCGGIAKMGLTARVEWKDTVSVFCVHCSANVCRTGPVQSEATKRQVNEAWNLRTPPAMSADHIGEAQGWRDIATAPRQEPVLVGHSGFLGWRRLAICNALGEWSYCDRPWLQQDPLDETPTHWHPLPPPPSAHPAPIKPSGDTGELRERVAQIIGETVNRRAPGQIVFSTLEDADAILDLIQSEKAG